jgi:CheY-like chemotaxis protein/anti-sigma regulatory factor (Ser/Thr protein kinase)
VAKIGAGRLELELHTVDVSEICKASLRLVQAMAFEKQITLELNIDSNTTTLQADERRLKQVLVNLLSNGIKFTPVEGQVGLEVTTKQGNVHFTVWDTGVGISPEGINYLQQEADKAIPFVQLDSSLSRQYEGTGLGLSLVYRLTELHGGAVSITSQVGQGSRFTISLPSQQHEGQLTTNSDTAIVNDIETTSPPSSSPHTATILLVEDNPDGLEALSEFLQYQGYAVNKATNGLEAIEHVRQQSPDLVLMDVQMPIMDGLEATRRIRADKTLANIPIIMLTALVMPEDQERCLAAGANAFIGKPFRLAALLGAIETHLQPLSEAY